MARRCATLYCLQVDELDVAEASSMTQGGAPLPGSVNYLAIVLTVIASPVRIAAFASR
jgi:hypothetical protein